MTDGPSEGVVDVSGDVPPPEKRRRRRGRKVLIGVGAVVAVLVVVFGVLVAVAVNDQKNEYDETAALKAGQCVSVTGMNTTEPNVVPADCAAVGANYRIGVALSGSGAACPAGDYDTYQQGARFGGDVTLCMVPNFVKGKCYLLNDAGTGPAPCKGKAGEGHIKVDQVLTGTTRKDGCDKASNLVLTYSQPATVLCARTLPAAAAS